MFIIDEVDKTSRDLVISIAVLFPRIASLYKFLLFQDASRSADRIGGKGKSPSIVSITTPLTADVRGIQPSSGKSTTLNSLTDASSKVGRLARPSRPNAKN